MIGHEVLKKAVCLLFLFALALFPVALRGAERNPLYFIQIGSFKSLENARRCYQALERSLAPEFRPFLHLEKTGNLYRVKIGDFEERGKAEALLPQVFPIAADAFLVRSMVHPSERETGRDSPEVPSFQRLGPSAAGTEKGKEGKKRGSPKGVKQTASFTGVIQDVQTVRSEMLGLPPGKVVYRLTLLLEETRPVEGLPNILEEKRGERMTFFAESHHPFFHTGNRISAVAEYRENATGRLYWLVSPRPISPPQ